MKKYIAGETLLLFVNYAKVWKEYEIKTSNLSELVGVQFEESGNTDVSFELVKK